jgi:hypothetical protein
MLFYDFFDTMLERTTACKNAAFASQLVSEDGRLVMKLLFPREGIRSELPARLLEEIRAAGGRVETMELMDSAGIWLSFPESSDE